MLKQKIVLNYALNITLQFLQIFGSILVARIAGATVLGTVAFGTAYVSTFIFIADLGLGTAHIKLVSATKDEKLLADYIKTFLVIKLVTLGLFLLLFSSVYGVQKYIFGYQYESRTHEIVIWVILASMVIQHLIDFHRVTFAGKIEVAKKEVVSFLRGFFSQVIRIAVVLMGFGAVAIAIGKLAASILVVPISFYLFRTYQIGTFRRDLVKKYLTISVPVIIIGFSMKLFSQLDKVLLQFMADSATVGYYTAGYKFAGFIQLLGVAIGTTLMPDFSRLFAEGKTKEVAEKIFKYERLAYVFLMPLALIFAIQSKFVVITLLGNEFAPSIPIMQISTLSLFFFIVTSPYGNVIMGYGNFKLPAKLIIVSLVVFILAVFLFVSPKMLNLLGTGMALSNLVSYFVLGLLYFLFSRKYCKELTAKNIAVYLPIGLLFFFAGLAVYYQYFDKFVLNFVFPFIFLAVYFSALYFLRMIDKRDFELLAEVSNIKKLFSYARNELRN